MKHGILPTTNRRQLRDRGRYLYISKPLVQAVYDMAGKLLGHLPLGEPVPLGYLVQIAVTPEKGRTYRKSKAKT